MSGDPATVRTSSEGRIAIVTIDRPAVHNAVDRTTALQLERAFLDFDADDALDVAILTGAGGQFCAGADLKAIAAGGGDAELANPLHEDLSLTAPMGPTRLALRKPVIAAIGGHAVAGGLELALWCDLRVADESAVFGVYCRRWGVPLIDGGTVRLPRLIGESRAMDLVLTGRAVGAGEAFDIGLVNRLVPTGQSLSAALALAGEIGAFPQTCVRNDRQSLKAQAALSLRDAMAVEFRLGLRTLASGEPLAGGRAFARRGRGKP
jgi:enoyl-CoA hydratase